jgi:hypothetical protein
VHQELYETARDTGLDDSLDLVVGAIGEVGDSPAGIDEDFVVERVDKLGEDGESRLDLGLVSDYGLWTMFGIAYCLPVGLGCLSPAEVAQGPGSVPEHAQLAAVAQKSEQRAKGAGLENEVAACGAVTSNVTKSPDSLLPDIRLVAAQKLDEDGHGTGLDDDLCLLCGAGGNVGEGPCCLELHQCVGRAQELDEAGDNAGLDNALDRRVALLRQELTELCGRLDLLVDLLGKHTLYHLRELLVELALR